MVGIGIIAAVMIFLVFKNIQDNRMIDRRNRMVEKQEELLEILGKKNEKEMNEQENKKNET